MNEHDELCRKGIHNFKGISVQKGWEDQYTELFEETPNRIHCRNCGLDLEVETVKKLLSLGQLSISLTLDELLEVVGDKAQ